MPSQHARHGESIISHGFGASVCSHSRQSGALRPPRAPWEMIQSDVASTAMTVPWGMPAQTKCSSRLFSNSHDILPGLPSHSYHTTNSWTKFGVRANCHSTTGRSNPRRTRLFLREQVEGMIEPSALKPAHRGGGGPKCPPHFPLPRTTPNTKNNFEVTSHMTRGTSFSFC